MDKSEEGKAYEERVKRRVRLLREKLKTHTVSTVEGQQNSFKESIEKMRFDKNGDPILETIDGRIRSLALAMEAADHRKGMKSAISLREIQERYFSILEPYFTHFHEMMIKRNVTPHILADNITYGGQDLTPLLDAVDHIIGELSEFWEAVAESGYTHLEDDNKSIKAVFGGDLFPAHGENIASKCGIYIDTIILPCPFIRTKPLFGKMDEKQRVYIFLKHAMNVLNYKELALANVDKPIVVILPDKQMMDEFAIEQVKRVGEIDALYHASKLFDRNFESMEELVEFGRELDTIEKVMNEVKDESKILFDLDFKETIKEQIISETKGNSAKFMGTDNPGLIVALNGFGRMGVCNELLFNSARIGGVPLIEAPTSWEYFKWKLEYDAERSHPNIDYKKLHVVQGLNGLNNTTLGWVSNIPTKGLIELRKNGAINEIREVLHTGIDELTSSEAMDFEQTSHKVFNNLNFALKQHQKNIDVLIKKKWKVAGKDFGSWLTMGSVVIASACVGTPIYGLSAIVLDQLMDAPKLRDLPKTVDKIKAIEQQKVNLKKSPIGLMLSYKK